MCVCMYDYQMLFLMVWPDMDREVVQFTSTESTALPPQLTCFLACSQLPLLAAHTLMMLELSAEMKVRREKEGVRERGREMGTIH